MEKTLLGGRVNVTVGDLTLEAVDALVNAANSSLLGGGGVDGAIHRRGGPEILVQCRELRRTTWPDGLPVGAAAITTGGRLAARFVIHTVGPVYGAGGGRVAELLGACYRNAVALAVQHRLATLAFPAISTGIYGYPREEAAVVASEALAQALSTAPAVRTVRLVFFTEDDATVFLAHQRFAP
jgi:O-acetyl-ADP-ribose deacetylase (regulator of RNase III)